MKSRALVFAAALFLGLSGALATQANTPEPQLTVSGCVQPEADYRAEVHERKGGIAGTSIGDAHEFVLRAVRMVSPESVKPIGTSDHGEQVYRLGGHRESELKNAVGHEIAVSGYVKGKPTPGTTRVKDLPEMTVVRWQNVSDHCAAGHAK